MENQSITPRTMIRLKSGERLSAESIVTARITVTYHFDDEPEPVIFQVKAIAPASDLDFFLIPYTTDANCDVEVEILDVLQPLIRGHDDNLKWLDNIKRLENGESL